jgi:hypothetical protein
MKEFVSVSQKADDICGKCGVKDKGCCKTEIKVVKVDDSQKSDLLNVDFLGRFQKFLLSISLFFDRSFSATKFTQIQINAPNINRYPSISIIVILEFRIRQSFSVLS